MQLMSYNVERKRVNNVELYSTCTSEWIHAVTYPTSVVNVPSLMLCQAIVVKVLCEQSRLDTSRRAIVVEHISLFKLPGREILCTCNDVLLLNDFYGEKIKSNLVTCLFILWTPFLYWWDYALHSRIDIRVSHNFWDLVSWSELPFAF